MATGAIGNARAQSGGFGNMNKKLYIILGIILIIIYFIVMAIFLFVPGRKETPPVLVTPTRVPVSVKPTKEGAIDRLKKQAVKNPLSTQERASRDTLIAKADEKTGYIITQSTFAFVYLRDEDIFQARLLTPKISEAKADVVTYLRTQGFSGDSLCKLPLFYYVHPRLLAVNETFNPIPDQCR